MIRDTEELMAVTGPGRGSVLQNLLVTKELTRGDALTFLIDLLITGIDTVSWTSGKSSLEIE